MNTLKLISTITLIIILVGIGNTQTFNDGTLEYTVISGTNNVSVKKAPGACTSTSITIPKTVDYNSTTYNVISIPNYAFLGCRSVVQVSIPASVSVIGEYGLSFMDALVSIDVDISNSNFSSESGVLFNKSKTVLLIYPSKKPDNSYIIPSTVVTIGEAAFGSNAFLTSVSIPTSVENIKRAAFFDCKLLKNINLPNSIITLERYVLAGTGIVSIVIPNSITAIPVDFFKECKSLTSVTIPNTITNIGYHAFDGCSSLSSVTIPNSVTGIGIGAFRGCTSLSSITIPNSVTAINSETFRGCTSLSSITIPNSVTSIGIAPFEDCTSLKSITIPSSVTVISGWAFKNCSSLVDIKCLAYKAPVFKIAAFLGIPLTATLSVPYGSLNTYKNWGYISSTVNNSTFYRHTLNKKEIKELSQHSNNQCFEATTRTIDASNNARDLYFHDSEGKLICMINANGNNLGKVTVEVNRNSGSRTHDGIAMLGRNVKITPTSQPSTPVKVRLYYTSGEMISGVAASTVNFSKTAGQCASTYGGARPVTVNQTGSGSIFTSDTFIETQVTDFSIFYASPNADQLTASTLPVDFAYIEATRYRGGIDITWATYSEKNNAYYEIEHSVDGMGWKRVATVQGAGDSWSKTSYAYTHKHPSYGHNYYRVKQVDYDGRFSYSDIALTSYLDKKMAAYPNPTEGMIYLDVTESQVVQIYNSTGVLIKEESIDKDNNVVDLGTFPDGFYTIRSGDKIERVIKK